MSLQILTDSYSMLQQVYTTNVQQRSHSNNKSTTMAETATATTNVTTTKTTR